MNNLKLATLLDWILPVFIFAPFLVYLLLMTLKITLLLPTTIGLVVIGAFFWTFAEYLLHRYVFHLKITNKFCKIAQDSTHGIHHKMPRTIKRSILPIFEAALVGILFYACFFMILGSAFAAPFYLGFVLGYLYYDLFHYALHNLPISAKWVKNLKVEHLKHHYIHEESNYGVTTQIWDRVFSSLCKK